MFGQLIRNVLHLLTEVKKLTEQLGDEYGFARAGYTLGVERQPNGEWAAVATFEDGRTGLASRPQFDRSVRTAVASLAGQLGIG